MAELILTPEEKASATYLEWDDASLGRAVKYLALTFTEDADKRSLESVGAAVFLLSNAIEARAGEMQLKLRGAVDGDHELGDWMITFTRLDSDSLSQES